MSLRSGKFTHISSLLPFEYSPLVANVGNFFLQDLHLLDGRLPLPVIKESINTVYNARFGSNAPFLGKRVGCRYQSLHMGRAQPCDLGRLFLSHCFLGAGVLGV